MADHEQEHEDTKGIVGTAGGGTAGALAGAGIGAAIGGPAGAVLGAGIGAVVGAAAGGGIDYATHEPDFRKHHESTPAFARHTWEEAAPAYRYGWESYLRPEFHDKTFHQVRHELHQGWTGSSDFADYEAYVEHAWDRQANSREAGSFSPAAKA